MSCVNSKNMERNLNISLHVFFWFLFLSIFFISIVSKTTKYTFEKKIKNTIYKNLQILFKDMKNKEKKQYTEIINDLSLENLEKLFNKPNIDLEINNKKIINQIIIINIILFILLCIYTFTIYVKYNNCIHFKLIFIEIIITFSIIAFINYIFYKHIVSQYIIVNPSETLKLIISDIKKYL